MESLASLDLPAYGYGIRYVNGMFRQRIDDGWQVELPETWLSHGNPWEFERRESAYFVGFGGEVVGTETGAVHWKPAEAVEAIAVDTPVVGWRGKRVNTLRLWTAQAIDPIRLDRFNAGDYTGALAGQLAAETLVRVLYPSDSSPAGQELRLRQEYFFLGLAPGHRPAAYPVFPRYPHPARQGGDPAQRHPSGGLGCGTDAAAHRSSRSGLRRGVGHHPPHLRLYQPHAAA